jgi:galactose mutarotase-like enzyme
VIYEIAGPGLRCIVDTDQGARIVSLRSDDGCEWLSPSYPAEQPGLGAPFVRAGMGGWDEVAPSVQADVLPDGTPVSDHGDIWNVPWAVTSAASDELVVETTLVSLPVTLRRTIRATEAGLRFEYTATTDALGEHPVLWCAHPQFSAGPHASLTLSLAGSVVTPELIEVHPNRGARREFPVAPLHAALRRGTSLKAFLPPGVAADGATLNLGGAESLRLSWDPASVGYLGLFWDNGEFAAEPVLAIEPATGWGDSISEAIASGQVMSVSAGSPRSWSLDLAVVRSTAS